MARKNYDVVVVGGGPAGLSAALLLGRCRWSVLLIDAGHGRNRRAHEMHAFLTRDGVKPQVVRDIGRRELARYGVEVVDGHAADATREGDGFVVQWGEGAAGESAPLATGDRPSDESLARDGLQTVRARKLLLATGVRDILPKVEGLDQFYGTSVHHCPFCDAWEHNNEPMIAYGPGDSAVGLALLLRAWSEEVTACTDGTRLSTRASARAKLAGIGVRTGKVARLEGRGTKLQRVVLESGEQIECGALFFQTKQVQRSDLPKKLGCDMKPNGGVMTNRRQGTCVRGLYLAGDAGKEMQFVMEAAAQGMNAAVAIHRELQDEAEAARAKNAGLDPVVIVKGIDPATGEPVSETAKIMPERKGARGDGITRGRPGARVPARDPDRARR